MDVEGGCLCGATRYRIRGRVSDVGQCHCSVCRRATGGGSTAVVFTAARSFEWLSGEDAIRSFRRPSGWVVSFCPTRGSPLPREHENGKVVVVPVGGLDESAGIGVMHHIFVGSKAGWDVIGDDGAQHEEWVPE